MPYCLALGAGYTFPAMPQKVTQQGSFYGMAGNMYPALSVIGTEVKFGATVVHTICSEQPANVCKPPL